MNFVIGAIIAILWIISLYYAFVLGAKSVSKAFTDRATDDELYLMLDILGRKK